MTERVLAVCLEGSGESLPSSTEVAFFSSRTCPTLALTLHGIRRALRLRQVFVLIARTGGIALAIFHVVT